MGVKEIQAATELYGIEDWGAGYFSINKHGHVVCTPCGPNEGAVSLPDIIEEAKKSGVKTPMIIRFPQVIRGQLEKMHSAFENAIKEFSFPGKHYGVFPFKVNQRREFIDAIYACGQKLDWGLEVGSKPEFMAGLSYPLNENSLFICNGFKDSEFIELAFLSAQLGRKVILVVEGPDEIEEIIKRTKAMPAGSLMPQIGLRVRLYSRGSGKWEKSSGETSKFGLTSIELIRTLEMMEEANLQTSLAMLHFHIGSQITAIKRFKNALREAARVYAKICKMGFAPSFLNIGGGVGVDYDGSQTTAQSSANYKPQEFANDAVYVIGEVCGHEEVPCPNIVTESGRIIAAYHSVVVTDIREVQGDECQLSDVPEISSKFEPRSHNKLREMRSMLEHMNSKNFNEFYHDAVECHEDLFTLFNLGYINLSERAQAEELFHHICRRSLYFASFQKHMPEHFSSLQRLKVSKYLANFSIFQSIPDAWSIDQLFPVMPLSRHLEKPSHKGTIVDITCDSDGCLERFIDRSEDKSELDLHQPNGSPYYLGFFLVGAYQESLANEHNLFGAIHEVEVVLEGDGSWKLSKLTPGDSISELLTSRNYDLEEITQSYAKQIDQEVRLGRLKPAESESIKARLNHYLHAYPYLVESH